MDFRQYDPAIGRFTSIDPIVHHMVSPYTGMDNNPVFWADPTGGNSVQDLIDEASKSPGVVFSSNGDGTFSGGGQTIGEKNEDSETSNTESESSFSVIVGAGRLTNNAGKSNNKNSNGISTNCDECPKLSGEEISIHWMRNPDENVIYTTDGKGNYRYYYKDGSTEVSTTTPGQKMLQDLTGLWLVNSIGKVFKYFGTSNKGKELFNFTKTAGAHMDEAGRMIPIQTLDDIIKTPMHALKDPQGTKAIMHYSQIWKNGKLYNVEVLYDKITNTIMHFKYTQRAIGPLSKIKK